MLVMIALADQAEGLWTPLIVIEGATGGRVLVPFPCGDTQFTLVQVSENSYASVPGGPSNDFFARA